MSIKPNSLGDRIVGALKLQRMTTNELAAAVYATHEMVRLRLIQLEKSGRVRRAGFANKTFTFGITPYLWEAA